MDNPHELRPKTLNGQTRTHWQRLRTSQQVRILEELTVDDARADVVANVARVRGMATGVALSTRRDLGEAVVIGHAKVLADAGHEVYVVIDDQGGQVLATREGLTVLTVEDLLLAAVQASVLAAGELRRTYETLIPFGSGLPSWDASSLKREYTNWRRSQKKTSTAAESN